MIIGPREIPVGEFYGYLSLALAVVLTVTLLANLLEDWGYRRLHHRGTVLPPTAGGPPSARIDHRDDLPHAGRARRSTRSDRRSRPPRANAHDDHRPRGMGR